MNRLIFVILIFFLYSCENRDLPEKTEEGKNTFGMLVNGEVWKPHYDGLVFAPEPLSVYYDPSLFTLSIHANNRKRGEQLSFYFYNIVGPGDYHFGYGYLPEMSDQDISFECCIRTGFKKSNNPDYSEISFILKSDKESYLHLTRLDTINKIVSGTFSVRLYSYNGDLLEITEGRFDSKY